MKMEHREKMREQDGFPKSLNISSGSYQGLERRSKPRIYAPFPANVRGVNVSGETFEVTTTLDNLSAGGLYLRMTQRVELGAKLFIVVRLSVSPSREVLAPRIAIRGLVLRAELHPDGTCGVAVAVKQNRFL